MVEEVVEEVAVEGRERLGQGRPLLKSVGRNIWPGSLSREQLLRATQRPVHPPSPNVFLFSQGCKTLTVW